MRLGGGGAGDIPYRPHSERVYHGRPGGVLQAPVNLGHVIDVINRVHAHEILVNGCFNGDPHPGNILLCPDGRVGLIDYGQVWSVRPKPPSHTHTQVHTPPPPPPPPPLHS